MGELPNGAILETLVPFSHSFSPSFAERRGDSLQDAVEQRRQADIHDGGEEAVARRLEQGRNALIAVLLTVGASSILAVMLDGDAGAVRVNEWAPLLMLGLLTLLVRTQAICRHYF